MYFFFSSLTFALISFQLFLLIIKDGALDVTLHKPVSLYALVMWVLTVAFYSLRYHSACNSSPSPNALDEMTISEKFFGVVLIQLYYFNMNKRLSKG